MGNIAVIGLGGMGRAIARNLVAAGHEVIVWNRSTAPVIELESVGARRVGTVAEAMQARVVMSVLSDDAAFVQTFLDSDVLSMARPGGIHVNLSTVSTSLARRATEAHTRQGLGYVAAPVFGRVPVAEAGTLNVLAAGSSEHLDAVAPYLDVIGSRTWRLGDLPEQANIVKILGNYLIACAIQSMGEAVSVAHETGADTSMFIELLSSTLFPGPVYAGYGAMIAERRYQPAAFTTTLGRKDLHLALDAANEGNISLPIGEVLRAVFDQALADGHAADDWSSIAEQQPR